MDNIPFSFLAFCFLCPFFYPVCESITILPFGDKMMLSRATAPQLLAGLVLGKQCQKSLCLLSYSWDSAESISIVWREMRWIICM
jgi:hypothetical protein